MVLPGDFIALPDDYPFPSSYKVPADIKTHPSGHRVWQVSRHVNHAASDLRPYRLQLITNEESLEAYQRQAELLALRTLTDQKAIQARVLFVHQLPVSLVHYPVLLCHEEVCSDLKPADDHHTVTLYYHVVTMGMAKQLLELTLRKRRERTDD